MLKSYKIAVTGGLSCGKSSTCLFLKELGAYVVSADEIVHQLLSSDTNLGQKIIDLIGPDIVVNHQIDRSRIAQKVFHHPKLLQSLEKLLHPAVYEEIEKRYQQVKDTPTIAFFVAEIPLLYESGGEGFFDRTIAVIADKEICKERFGRAMGYEKEEYEKRIARQLSTSEKAHRADYVIVNNGSLAQMRDAVKKIFDTIIQLPKRNA